MQTCADCGTVAAPASVAKVGEVVRPSLRGLVPEVLDTLFQLHGLVGRGIRRADEIERAGGSVVGESELDKALHDRAIGQPEGVG